jgi:uncharacterized protein
MPVTTTELAVGLGRQKLWTLLNDPQALGGCVPGCEEVQVLGPDDSRWKVKLSVGIITRRIEARAHVTERNEPEKISLKLESLDGDITGAWSIVLTEVTPTLTKIRLTADMTARGAFEWVVNQVIQTQMGKLAKQFGERISAKASAMS